MLTLINVFNFFIPGIPKARNSIRVNAVTDINNNPVRDIKGRVKIAKFHSKESKNDLAYIKWSLVKLRPKGWVPHAGPVAIKKLHYIFPFTKEAAKRRFGMRQIVKTSKPDLQDNLNKLLFDAMKGIIIADDNLVFEMNDVMKLYGDNPGIEIIIHLFEETKT